MSRFFEQILIGGVLALMALAVLALWYARAARKAGEPPEGGLLPAGLGFGLLPALATGLIFLQDTSLGRGVPLMEPMEEIAWLSAEGRFMPCRIESLLCLICFAGLCLWLMFRKAPLSGGWETAETGLCLWAGIRLMSESLRAENVTVVSGMHLLRFVYAALMLVLLLVRVVRGGRAHRGQALVSLAVFAVAVAAVLLTGNGILTTGSDMSDLIVCGGGAALASAAVLMAGGERYA